MYPHIGAARQVPNLLLLLALAVVQQYVFTKDIPHRFTQQQSLQKLISQVSSIVWLLAVYNILRAAFRDPGVIPASNISPSEGRKRIIRLQQTFRYTYNPMETYELDQIVDDAPETSRGSLSPSRQQGTAETGEEETSHTSTSADHSTCCRIDSFRYCEQCKNVQEPLAMHCPACKICVKEHELHSSAIANCIGIRNIRNLFVGLVLMLVNLIAFIAISVVAVYNNVDKYLKFGEEKANSDSAPTTAKTESTSPEYKLQGNDQLLLCSSLVFVFWAIAVQRRMRGCRFLSKLYLLTVLVYLKIKYNISLAISGIQEVYIVVTILLALALLPGILQYLLGLLPTVLLTKKGKHQIKLGLQSRPRCKEMLGNLCSFLWKSTE